MQKERTHVLLVEDEEGHIRLMLKAFEAFADRFRITLAHNLADARSYIKEKTPDLLILDYNLPDGKGLELLKDHVEMPLFPVIVLTGFGDEKLAVQTLKLGATDYVVKSAGRLRDIPNIAERALREWKAIVKQKQTEEALKDSEERFRTLVQSAVNVIIHLSADHKIIEFNPEAERLFDVKREEVLGKDYFKLFLPEKSRKAVDADMKKVLAGEPTRGFESIVSTKNGKERLMSWNVNRLVSSDGVSMGVIAIGQDITERKRAENILSNIAEKVLGKTGEEYFQSLTEFIAGELGTEYALIGELDAVNNMVETIAVYAHGKIMDNIKYSLTNTPCDNVMGKKACIYPQKVQELFPEDELLVEMGVESYTGIPLFGSNGQTLGIVVALGCKPMKDKEMQNSMSLLQIFSSRASSELERRKAEKALSESEQKYRLLFENMTIGFALHEIIYDDQGHPVDYRYLEINPAFEKMTGVPAAALLGKTVKEVLPNTEQYWIDVFGKVAQTGVPVSYKNYARELGKYYDTWAFSPEKDQFAVLFSDITDRVKAEEALKRSEEKYSALVEKGNDIIIMIQDYIVKFANPKLAEITGYNQEEIIGMNSTDLVSPRYRELVKERARKRLAGEDVPSMYEVELLTAGGQVVPVEMNVSTIDYKDKPAIMIIMRDITERKNLQDQLIQVQKMESIGTLAGGIAHDFNNILNAIYGFTYLAKMKLPEGSDAADKLDSLTQAANRATDLVRQILLFSRKTVEELQPTLAAPVVKEALKLLRASIPATIEMRENISPVRHVLADSVQIHQILMNLCTNAYHAMQETGGMLEVDLREVNVGPDFASQYVDLKPGPYVRLTVSDTGKGIDPSVVNRIFEPYFTTKEKGKGTGLGLSVVHGIVKNYGGEITVTSELSRGTTFQVYMPVIQKEEKQTEKVDETLLNGTGSVLFVDDEKSTVLISTEILESLGYKVTGQTDSQEALKLFREKPDEFDVVITDMTMPKMTGIKLAEEMIGIRPDIPVILCTGFSEGINEEMVKQKGIREFLMKPVAPVNIAKAIHTVLEGTHPEPNNPGREVT